MFSPKYIGNPPKFYLMQQTHNSSPLIVKKISEGSFGYKGEKYQLKGIKEYKWWGGVISPVQIGEKIHQSSAR